MKHLKIMVLVAVSILLSLLLTNLTIKYFNLPNKITFFSPMLYGLTIKKTTLCFINYIAVFWIIVFYFYSKNEKN